MKTNTHLAAIVAVSALLAAVVAGLANAARTQVGRAAEAGMGLVGNIEAHRRANGLPPPTLSAIGVEEEGGLGRHESYRVLYAPDGGEYYLRLFVDDATTLRYSSRSGAWEEE